MKLSTLLKGFAIAAVAAIAINTASAQIQSKGDMGAGASLVVGFGDSWTNFGLGLKYQYCVIDNLRLEPSFTYFFPKDDVSNWDISANVHYLFNVGNDISLYPLAGFGVYGAKAKGFDGVSDFVFNIGAGVDYYLFDNWSLNAELKWKVKDGTRTLLSVGATYAF